MRWPRPPPGVAPTARESGPWYTSRKDEPLIDGGRSPEEKQALRCGGPRGTIPPEAHAPTATMAESESIIELELGCRPEAAVSGAVLVQTEYNTFLTFNAMRATDRMSPYGGPFMDDAGIALIEFEMCSVTKFGYPNDEAWGGIPRTRGLSYGIFEVQNSKWIRELTALNRHSFPNTPDDVGSRHFLFLFHDSSFECIVTGMKLELFDGPYRNVFARITERVLGRGS